MPKKKEERLPKKDYGWALIFGVMIGAGITLILVATLRECSKCNSINECPDNIWIPTYEEEKEFCKSKGYDYGGVNSLSCSGGIQCWMKLTEDTTKTHCFTAEEVFE
jgi:hypothetical protein